MTVKCKQNQVWVWREKSAEVWSFTKKMNGVQFTFLCKNDELVLVLVHDCKHERRSRIVHEFIWCRSFSRSFCNFKNEPWKLVYNGHFSYVLYLLDANGPSLNYFFTQERELNAVHFFHERSHLWSLVIEKRAHYLCLLNPKLLPICHGHGYIKNLSCLSGLTSVKAQSANCLDDLLFFQSVKAKNSANCLDDLLFYNLIRGSSKLKQFYSNCV